MIGIDHGRIVPDFAAGLRGATEAGLRSRAVRVCLCRQDDADAPGSDGLLHGSELSFLDRLGGSDARRRSWMGGRFAAKQAVMGILAERYGIKMAPDELSILPDDAGCPRAGGELLRQLGIELGISISHAGGYCAALALECEPEFLGAGIDIENTQDNHEGLKEGGFSADELHVLDKLCQAPRESCMWLLRMWCVKEAVVKSIGTGFGGNPLDVRVRSVNAATGEMEVEIDPRILPEDDDQPGRAVAVSGLHWGLAYALCVRNRDARHGD